MAEKIADVGENLALFRVNVDEIKEQDVNAHVMAPEMFDRLTENIKKEKRLESLPFTVARSDKFELVSGHHRVRAARAAGLNELFVLADTRNLGRAAVVAKQIAHNRIFGKDDPQTLKQLFMELDSTDAIIESYLRPEEIDDVNQFDPASVVDISVALPWKHLTLVFLPSTGEALERIAAVVKRTPKDTDEIGVVNMELLERFRAAALVIGRTDNIRSMGAILTRMTEICEAHIAAAVDDGGVPAPDDDVAAAVEPENDGVKPSPAASASAKATVPPRRGATKPVQKPKPRRRAG